MSLPIINQSQTTNPNPTITTQIIGYDHTFKIQSSIYGGSVVSLPTPDEWKNISLNDKLCVLFDLGLFNEYEMTAIKLNELDL